MAALRVEVLGGLDVQTESGPIRFATRKALALFAYLALDAGRTHGRTQLHGLLWGDCEDRQARGSLRYALTDIRKALGQYRTALCTDRDRIGLKPDDVAVDASEFERLAHSHVSTELRRAVALYRGDLLAGVEIRAPAFNEWIEEERERLRGLFAQALGRLLEMGPDYDLAQRLLALDPYNEIAHRALMRHYADQKQWTLAMRQFDACATLLKRELGVAPEAATCSLRETIVNRRPASGGATSSPAGTASNFGPPGIAVSTFGCIDAVPETAAMASGLREAVATELARFRDVNVFRDRSADGAQFSLEATLQRLGSRLRLTATLTEKASAHQIWAERYQRNAGDAFTLQDELAATIATTTVASLTRLVHERAQRRAASDLRAYECFVRGNRYVDQVGSPEALAQAQYWFEKALQIDPSLARAHNGMAFASVHASLANVGAESSAKLDQALRHAETAIELDPTDPRAHYALAYVSLQRQEFARAQRHFLQALQINPNDPTILASWGYAQACLGDADSGLKTLESALQLVPAPPGWYFVYLTRVLLLARRPAESVAQFGMMGRTDGPRDLAWHGIACAHAGRHTEAARLVAGFITAMRARWRGDVNAGEREFASWFLESVLLARTEDRDFLRHGLGLAGLNVQ